jgi:hypothetical protein
MFSNIIMTEVYAGIMNKKGKNHKSKKVKSGKCVFPFFYRNKEYNNCLDTGNGPWCPTSLTKKNRVKEWGYCVEKDVSNAANILSSMKRKGKGKKGGNRMVLPSEYFGVKSGNYVGGRKSKGKRRMVLPSEYFGVNSARYTGGSKRKLRKRKSQKNK